jgi:glycosyltransferase involved in cell wall biosynthesis
MAVRNAFPFVSVVIPTYNRKDILCLTLSALAKQNYPNYEIIVVDDGSDDGSDKMIQSLRKKHLFIRYCRQKKKGFRVARARNLGGRLAKGEFLVFLNDDIVALPDLIASHVRALEKFDFILGYTAAYFGKETYDIDEIKRAVDSEKLEEVRIIKEFRHDLFVNPKKKSSKCRKNISGNFVATNFSTHTKLFQENHFSEFFFGWGVEDEEYGYRLLKKNYTIKLDRDCMGLHMPHLEERLVGIYTEVKVLALLRNLLKFFDIYPTREVEEYIKARYSGLPEEFKNEDRERRFSEGIEAVKRYRLR